MSRARFPFRDPWIRAGPLVALHPQPGEGRGAAVSSSCFRRGRREGQTARQAISPFASGGLAEAETGRGTIIRKRATVASRPPCRGDASSRPRFGLVSVVRAFAQVVAVVAVDTVGEAEKKLAHGVIKPAAQRRDADAAVWIDQRCNRGRRRQACDCLPIF